MGIVIGTIVMGRRKIDGRKRNGCLDILSLCRYSMNIHSSYPIRQTTAASSQINVYLAILHATSPITPNDGFDWYRHLFKYVLVLVRFFVFFIILNIYYSFPIRQTPSSSQINVYLGVI